MLLRRIRWRGAVHHRFAAAQTAAMMTFTLDHLQEEPVNLDEGVGTMNKDQVKGTAKDIAGKVQEKAGKLVGSKAQEIKGIDKQISGKAEKNFGDAKEHIKAAIKHS